MARDFARANCYPILISVPSLNVTLISSLLYTVMKSTSVPHRPSSNSVSLILRDFSFIPL